MSRRQWLKKNSGAFFCVSPLKSDDVGKIIPGPYGTSLKVTRVSSGGKGVCRVVSE